MGSQLAVVLKVLCHLVAVALMLLLGATGFKTLRRFKPDQDELNRAELSKLKKMKITLDLSSSRIQMGAWDHTLTPFCSVCRQFFGFIPGDVHACPSNLV